jgi:membrane fusion protein, multidrug efflux system
MPTNTVNHAAVDPLQPPTVSPPPPGRNVLRAVIVLVILAVAGAVIWVGRSASRNRAQNAQSPGGVAAAQRAIPVGVASVERRDMPVYLSGLGTVQAFNTVTVRTRVDGQLVEVRFREGQQVRKGDLLAVIDPRPFQVALNQAQATLFRDQANLKNAQLDLERYSSLYKQGVIAQQQYNTQQSTVGQLEGAVRADQSAVNNARLNLAYAHITAPIGGRVGLRLVDAGNMVHATDANGLLVITQLQPIAVIFTLPENELPIVARRMQSGALEVDAFTQDNRTRIATGKLLTIDNQIDPTTGTFKLKSVFDNRDRSLWPNQFVNSRLLLSVAKNALVVPASAIQRGAQGTFVYVVKPGNTVDARSVHLALTEGALSAVDQGLNANESVVTDGQDKLQPGSTVQPQQQRSAPQAASTQPASPGQAAGTAP